MRKIAIPALVILVVAAVLAASLLRSNGDVTEVEVTEVGRRTVTSRVKASGEITPERKVEISAKVTGEIVGLPVREGDTVRAGQVLVRIEDDLYRAARDQAQAALSQAQVAVRRAQIRLADAERTLHRTEELHAGGLASREQLDQAESAWKSAEVEVEAQRRAVEQARYALERAERDLARTVIRSPMDGMVIQRNAEKGETVVPGTTNLPGSVIMTIADMSRLLAEVEVGEVDVVHVALGQPAEVRVDALGDDVLHGKVVEIATSGREDAQQRVIRFKVKVALQEHDPRLRPAMTAKVDILTARHEKVTAVPIQAVVKRRLDDEGHEIRARKGGRERDVVYVVQDGTARVRPVRLGISDDLYVEIVEGLEPGIRVITGPYKTLKRLRDGTRVTVREESGRTTPTPETKR